ncbi:hypothetical protein G7Y79_00016g040760 [Physcia stellaris]|nr:hypothetical protein G7Y79_00016g040760 [Physcia stellaris]
MNLTPHQKDNVKATSLRIDRLLASPSTLEEFGTFLYASGFKVNAFSFTLNSASGNQIGNGNGSQNGTGAETGAGNRNGTELRTERSKRKTNDVWDVKALVTSWKPYLLWYMLEAGTPASSSYVDIAASMTFGALYAKYFGSKTPGGAESGISGGGTTSPTLVAHLFSAFMQYSTALRRREFRDWAPWYQRRGKKQEQREALKSYILDGDLEHERRFREILREIEEAEDKELGREATLLGLEREFMRFCDREGIEIVPT